MKPLATGLVVGKFTPLHCGHEKLINAALVQYEEPFIISYSVPEMFDCGPEKRLTRLQMCFPQATTLVLTPELAVCYNLPTIPYNGADIHCHYVATLYLQILRCRPHAVFTAEDYGDGFANMLARHFVRSIKRVRMARPVGDEVSSGMLIRSDVHHCRYMLTDDVYYNFVCRICLFDDEFIGKSTFSRALADGLDMIYAAEFGRGYWEEKDGILTADGLLHIACG